MIWLAVLTCFSFSQANSRASGLSIPAACSKKDVIENCWIKPCHQDLDFDGDGKLDRAHLVSKGSDGPKGILILMNGGKCFLAGAGDSIGAGGENFYWMNTWSVYKAYRDRKDGLSVYKEEIGGTIFLEKAQLNWEQGGD